jgi:large subunit ribosomal protein L25
VLREAGGSHLIQLRVEGEAHNALVREVQRDPIRGDVLHVDFYRVRMDVAIRAEVPLELIGSDKTIQANGGTVMRKMTSIVVECLPGDLPSNVQLDISSFTNVGEMLTVAALPVLPGVKYMANPAEIVAVTTLLTQREEEEIEGVSSSEPELIRRKAEEFDEE